MLRTYYRLAKPGIVYGNALTTLAAFLYASHWNFTAALFLLTMLGIALVIASACVFNNYLDRDIDAKMGRTKDRALPSGKISGNDALIYASLLGFVGFWLLLAVNLLTAFVALIGFFFYVIPYTYSKRHTPLGTLIGSIPGAVPIVVGYTAVTNRLDETALILFLILVCWQMPHFYAIAIRRLEEYRAANIPVLPLVVGMRATKWLMLIYIILYLAAVSSLTIMGAAGTLYLAVAGIPGLVWLWFGIRGFSAPDDVAWARRVFLMSLVVLLTFSVALSIGSVVS